MSSAVRLLVASLALSSIGASSCDTAAGDAGPVVDASTEPPDASPSCLEAVDHADLPWIQEKVITPTCAAFSACHKGAAGSAGDLNLEADNFEANVVGVPSELEPTMDLVTPGAPADSYLMVILGHYGVDDARIDASVGTMPYNLPLLCVEKRDAIARWIESLPPADR
jgi:hypothetical protein